VPCWPCSFGDYPDPVGSIGWLRSFKGRRQVSSESIELIFRALTLAGVEFIDENGGGPGVRLCKRQRAKQPR
jgi:hypothetical protein